MSDGTTPEQQGPVTDLDAPKDTTYTTSLAKDGATPVMSTSEVLDTEHIGLKPTAIKPQEGNRFLKIFNLGNWFTRRGEPPQTSHSAEDDLKAGFQSEIGKQLADSATIKSDATTTPEPGAPKE